MKIQHSVTLLLMGGIMGSLLTWIYGYGSAPSKPTLCSDDVLCSRELQIANNEVQQLRQKLSDTLTLLVQSSAPDPKLSGGAAMETDARGADVLSLDQTTSAAPIDESVRWRVSAVEKFVPLSQDQRERLQRKFLANGKDGQEGDAASESLEDILGADHARFYREQVSAAFKRHHDQQLEREVLWFARRLALTPEQEHSLRGIFSTVERQLEADAEIPGSNSASLSAREGVKRMIAENRRRSELRNEQLKAVLGADQYSEFLRAQAESSASDVEVFHDPG